MKKAMLGLSVLALLAAPAARAGDPDLKAVFTPESGLEVMKTLDGDWAGEVTVTPLGKEGESATTPSSVSYRVSGAGSMVIATYGAGKPTEMITVYHLDGPDTLMLTHYCALKNQPQMKFEATGEKGFLKFAFAGGTNFDPEVDAHAHEGTLRFIDADTIETTSVGFSGGKPSTQRKTILKRQK